MSKLLIGYIMGELNFIDDLKRLSENGGEIVEIGVRFCDGVGDGGIIMKGGGKVIDEG